MSELHRCNIINFFYILLYLSLRMTRPVYSEECEAEVFLHYYLTPDV